MTSGVAHADDGYDLWLRYGAHATTAITVPQPSATLAVATAELRRGLPTAGHAILLARATSPQVATLKLDLGPLGDEGYAIRQVRIGGRPVTLITGNSDRAILYGAFALIRQAHTGGTPDSAALTSMPRIKLRVLDHWDNLDGTVERGYAGQSLWDWWTLPAISATRATWIMRAPTRLSGSMAPSSTTSTPSRTA